MGNVLKTPTLGAITPNFPHVLTNQVVNSAPKPIHQKAATITERRGKLVYYVVIAAAAIYLFRR